MVQGTSLIRVEAKTFVPEVSHHTVGEITEQLPTYSFILHTYPSSTPDAVTYKVRLTIIIMIIKHPLSKLFV